MKFNTLKYTLAISAAIGILGCSSSASSVPATVPTAEPGLYKDHVIEVDGVSRTFDFFIPTNLGSSNRPLVFLFHGARSNTDALTGEGRFKSPYALWMDIAETEKIIVVYPQGAAGPVGGPGWNDCRADATTNPTEDDLAFVDTLLGHFSNSLPVDGNRIYAAGTSNGGHMSLRLAQEMSDKIAAVASVVAAMPAVSCSQPVNPISILFMNGTADPLLPYRGGEVAPEAGGRGTVLSAQASVETWVRFNQTNVIPTVHDFEDINRRDGSTVTSMTYGDGIKDTEVVLYEVAGGGHVEPSIRERYSRMLESQLGRQNHDLEMATEIWNFFQNKTLGVADPGDDFTSLNPAMSQVYRSIHPLTQQRQTLN